MVLMMKLHSLERVQPARLGVIIEFQPRHVSPVLAFDIAHTARNDGPALVDDQDIFAQLLDLFQLVG